VTLVQGTAAIIARIVLVVVARMEVRGRENLRDLPKKVIFAANHTNDIDSVLVRNALPLFSHFTPLIAVARNYEDYGWTGWKALVYRNAFFRLLGAYPSYRGLRDYARSLRVIIQIARMQQSVLIFAGGKQHTAAERVRVRGGTGYLSWATGYTVVPVSISGSYGFGVHSFLRRPRIIVCFGKPYTKSALFGDSKPTVAACRATTAKVVDEIERMRRTVRQELVSQVAPKPTTPVSTPERSNT